MMRLLEVNGIDKWYGDKQVIRGISFSLAEGEIGCLLGPSGCGKTTLLRTVAGFEDIRGGSIAIAGQTVASATGAVPPEARGIGMVFQDYALFPHLTVAANVAFGLKHGSGGSRSERVRELLEVVGLTDHADSYPHELSGGQQQRVALARALAPRPKLLLLDEPFSNLDVTLRERLSMEVRSIIKREGATALMVTHNQNEAFAIADKAGVLRDGVMQQWDDPHALYHRPATPDVAGFVGEGVLIPGIITEEGAVRCGLGDLAGVPRRAGEPGRTVSVLVRPEDVVHQDESPVTATILAMAFRGASILYTLRLDSGDNVLSLVPSHHNHAVGQRIGIRAEVEDLVLFSQGATPVADQRCLTEYGEATCTLLSS